MPRHRLPEGERKERIYIRLKEKYIKLLLEDGHRINHQVERAVYEYLKKMGKL